MSAPSAPAAPSTPSAPLGRLARLLASHSRSPLPADVREAARRTLYNVLATAVGAAREPATDLVVAALGELGTPGAPGGGRALVPGRAERLAPLDAALATGIAAHLDDYDDTHLRTVIHPGAACLGALTGLQEEIAERDAEEILGAFAWGVEAQLRLGVSVSPAHYDAGWHITGTCGALGAAVTAGLLLGLDETALRTALEWAVEDGLGNREGFGSMTKPYHPGKAAVAGLRAARDAAAGLGGPGDTLTGPQGLAHRLAGGAFEPAALLDEMGERWELLDNTFKPYPCGIVTHPAIEAAEALHRPVAEHGGPGAVTAIRLHCHPLVPELTGTIQPADGLQARFSTAHGMAAGLLLPRVDLGGYATEVVVSAAAGRLRSLVAFLPEPERGRDSARVEVAMADGALLVHEVAHARGSLARPLTEEELGVKARGLVERVLPGGTGALEAAARDRGPGYLGRLLRAAVPADSGDSPARAARKAAAGAGERPAAAGPSPDVALAELLATAADVPGDHRHVKAAAALLDEAAGLPSAAPAADERARAGALAAALVAAGRRPVVAAAVAACAAPGLPRADGARAVALALAVTSRLAERLDVPVDRLPGLAATLASAAAHRLPPRAALAACGLAGTRTTGVTGTTASPALDARRAQVAAAEAVESTALARHGFTAPARPLTGRRGLLSLLAHRPEPDPAAGDPLGEPALDALLDPAPAG
ncbi:MmgE/PrpD family protein [Streptomyces hoynatensis]|uniref:MmgE/PrpD family protein n=1 Tax=Streptomyces hoynatensis TaxID=1141874 RepID=A0A3A9ZCH6_9ACTN|nr:MmgE/PrpD family protein [Streptomyces hoynatensis]RKN45875.1 MmgE/PrpD family protein [Streptomyces hoynatensis]